MALSPSVVSASTVPAPTQPSLPSPPADPALLRRLSLLLSHLVVALVALVAIGGATRVMEAGLACPDWPLCYGVLLPGRQMNLQVFLEWFHRLDAFVVGIALLVMAGVAIWKRRVLPGWFSTAAVLALLLVAGQGALGALTVTQLLAAPMVTAHLGTALLLVGLLSAVQQGLQPAAPGASPLPLWWRGLALMALLAVFSQCLLGGAMASQWAADRCLAFGEGCRWLALHRSGATPAALLVLTTALASFALPQGHPLVRGLGLTALALVAAQIALGVATLRLQLAVPLVTVGHQIVAALLVAVLAAAAVADVQPRPEVAHG
jgi:cytochrome c oxidase assembly protein subunit 15